MADPLSLTTSVITIVEATAKVSSMCRKYYKSVRKAQEVVLHLLSEVQTLRTITEQLDARLHDHDAAAALGGVDDGDGDGDDGDDGDHEDNSGDQDERDPSPSTLPIVRSLMNDDGVFERCVACLQDLETRLEVHYNAWNAQKQSLQGPEEASGTWHQKREKARGLAMRLVWPLKESEVNESIDIIHRLCSIIQMALGVEMVLKVNDIDRKADAVHSTVTDIQRKQAAQAAREDIRRAAEAAAQEKARRLRQRLAICSWLDGSRKQEAKNESVYKQRAPNTSSWLLESASFTAWRAGSDARKMFWLQAIPGCGKTVLASAVIHHLSEQIQPSTAALAYFYFDASDDQMTTSNKMLRSLLAQLVQHAMVEDDGPLPEPTMRLARNCLRRHRLGELFAESPPADSKADTDLATYDIKEGEYGVSPPSADEVLTALQETASGLVQGGRNIYVVIDALDECTDINALLRILCDGILVKPSAPSTVAVGSGRLNLFCTSRHMPSISEVFDLRTSFVVTADREAGQNEDIAGMVRQQLEQDGKLRRWTSMHEELQEALTKRAQGMFRLVACQLDILRRCKTLRSLREALRTLPTTLSDTYKTTILALNEDDRAYAVRALLWLAVSTWPPTVREMVDFLAVDMEETDEDTATGGCRGFVFNEEQRINDLSDIPVLCTTLVQTAALPEALPEADTENLELRLAHHTVREYVLSKPFLFDVVQNDESLPAFLRQITDQRALHAHVATTLLSYLLCLQDPVRNHIGVTMCGQDNVCESYCSIPLWKLQVGDTVFNPGCLLNYQLWNRPLAGYAAGQWTFHFRLSWSEDSQLGNADKDTNATLVTQAMRMLGPENCSDEKGRANMTLSYINMVRIREGFSLANWSRVYRFRRTGTLLIPEPLSFASSERLDMLIPTLLGAWDRHSPHLHNAAVLSRPKLLRMLVDDTSEDENPLVTAQKEDLLGALLEHVPLASIAGDVDVALIFACNKGTVDNVRKLLEAGARPDPALYPAVSSLFVDCVELLLPLVSDNVRQYAFEDFGESVFTWDKEKQAQETEIKRVLTLFAKYLPVAVLPCASRFALHDLTSDILLRLLGAGDIGHMRQLLSRGTLDATVPVPVDGAPDIYPLFLAVLACNADLVGLFLEHGAAADAPDTRLGTPLAQAAYLGDLDVARRLVEQGHASLTDTNSVYGSPVQAAVCSMCVTHTRVAASMMYLDMCDPASTFVPYHRQRCCDMLNYLLAHGANANQVAQPTDAVAPFRVSNVVYTTPLCMAAKETFSNEIATPVAAVLLAHGADPKMVLEISKDSTIVSASPQKSALAAALDRHNMPLSEDLLAAGACADAKKATALLAKALRSYNDAGCLDVLQRLFSHGADANVYEPSFGHKATLFSTFCFNEYDANVMRVFLDAGADPNGHSRYGNEYGTYYEPPLHILAHHSSSGKKGRAKMRMLVTEYGVDVNAAADGDGDTASQGWTALLRAASNSDPDLLVYLLDELGADPAARLTEGSSAVHVAAAHNCVACLAVLAKHLDVNLCNHAGRTPLHEAAARGAVAAVGWLLRTGGADASAKDAKGQTARDLAQLYKAAGAVGGVLGMDSSPFNAPIRFNGLETNATGRQAPWFADQLLALLEETKVEGQSYANSTEGCNAE